MISIVKRGKINICKLVLGKLNTNCYIVYSEQGEGFIVDPADRADIIRLKLEDLKLKVKGILLTHGHFDHIGAALELRDIYKADIYAGENEKGILESSRNNLSCILSSKSYAVKADKLLQDGQELMVAGFEIKVIETPGHTAGSVCYLVSKNEEAVLLSGDTVFRGSCGRYDFPTGSYDAIIRSIREKLLVLDDKLEVFPGHNEETSIGEEKQWYF